MRLQKCTAGAAALLEAAGVAAAQLLSAKAPAGSSRNYSSSQVIFATTPCVVGCACPSAERQSLHLQAGAAGFVEGFRLIAASGYLRLVALFVVSAHATVAFRCVATLNASWSGGKFCISHWLQGLNYVVSSAFYFEKAAVTAAGISTAASRTALFAAINGASAAIVGTVQVCTTSSLMHLLP